jgi:mannosyl-oligosaccharide alpha-1,2-mannosidase
LSRGHASALELETPKKVYQTIEQEHSVCPHNEVSSSNEDVVNTLPIAMAPLVRRVAIIATSAVCSLFLLVQFSKSNILQTSILPVPPPPRISLFDVNNLPPFKWRDLSQQNPVDLADMFQLPNGPAAEIPQIQHAFEASLESETHKEERQRRLAAVKVAFKHSWSGYRNNAWLHDEVRPMSGHAADPFGGWAATLVDTLDTLWIMGLQAEFEEAVNTLDSIDFSTSSVREINVFETTIRYLGGFLSAYDLSDGQYPMLLQKAEEVAELLYRAFDTPNRMPITRWNWAK